MTVWWPEEETDGVRAMEYVFVLPKHQYYSDLVKSAVKFIHEASQLNFWQGVVLQEVPLTNEILADC